MKKPEFMSDCAYIRMLEEKTEDLEAFLDHEHKIRFDRENVPNWEWYFKEWKKKKTSEPKGKSLTEQMKWCEITEGREGYKNSLDLWLDWREEDN